MKFKVLSDIHLEWYNLSLPDGKGTTLLLAGDICVADYLRPGRFPGVWQEYVNDVKRFFFEDCATYDSVYYVMGNHEHYDGAFENTVNILREFLQGSNVTLMDKQHTYINDTDFAIWGGTLWTNFDNRNPHYMIMAKQGMNDYRSIKTGNRTLTPLDTLGEHLGSMADLEEFLKTSTAKNIVVMTHMGPSSLSRHPRFDLGDPLNWAYYSSLEETILNNPKIKVWVHGHTHDSHDYMIGETRILCNPRGYTQSVGTQENETFDINKTFEVK